MTRSKGNPDGPSWQDEAFIKRTQDVWSKAYGRPVSKEEALEIIGNVHQLGQVLLQEAIRRRNT